MSEEQQVHKRRKRYSGTHPRRFEEKYKEHDPEKYQDTIEKVISKGSTPAGMHLSIMVQEILDFLQIEPGQQGLDALRGLILRVGTDLRYRAAVQLASGLCAVLNQMGAGDKLVNAVADMRKAERGHPANFVIAHPNVQIILQKQHLIPSYLIIIRKSMP